MARTFPNQSAETSDSIDYGTSAPIIYSNANATFMCWFRRPTAPVSGNFPCIFQQRNANLFRVEVLMNTTGNITVNWRGGTFTNTPTTNSFDDDVYHRLVIVRNSSSPFIEVFVDGASEGTNTTDPGTSSNEPVREVIGNQVTLNAGWGGEIARVAFVLGTSLSVQAADSFLYTGRSAVPLDFWMELIGSSPEPDWSGNGNNGTVTGSSVGPHAPVGPPFGFDLGWQGNFAAGIGADEQRAAQQISGMNPMQIPVDIVAY